MAVLPVGLPSKAHLKTKASPLASVLPEPSMVTTAPTNTLWLTPGFATGAELVTDATTVAVTKVLLNCPSFTTKLAE